MDGYSQPKDAKLPVWGHANSSDQDDLDINEQYSEPYKPGQAGNGVVSGRPPGANNDYEVPDYDVPPSRDDDYSHLNSTRPVAQRNSILSHRDEDSDDDYNHTKNWQARQADKQNGSGGVVPGAHPSHSDRMSYHEATAHVRRSRGVRRSLGDVGDRKPIPNSNAQPALYEDAWDTAQRQRKLEERLQLVRTLSSTSDKFEDAVEYQPEEPAPPERSVKSGRQTDPVTGGTYEQAWDLNRGLEEKLRNLTMMHTDSGDGGGDTATYQEPWDTARKQRELEEKLQRASTDGLMPVSPKHHPKQLGSDLYEEAWDIKRSSLSQLIMGPHGREGGMSSQSSTRSTQSIICSIAGEPINAMIPLDSQDWYHGNITREDAEQILRVCKDGSYLVRDSSDGQHYTLSVKSRIMIHIQIDQRGKAIGSGPCYILGKNSKKFRTIPAMIDYYTQHPVPIKGADHMALMYPVRCHWSGADG